MVSLKCVFDVIIEFQVVNKNRVSMSNISHIGKKTIGKEVSERKYTVLFCVERGVYSERKVCKVKAYAYASEKSLHCFLIHKESVQ